MAKVAIFAFLIGLSVYQGITWTRKLDASAGVGDSRNVFITFNGWNGIVLRILLVCFCYQKY